MTEAPGKTVFATVGSTKFNAMVDAVCHPETLQLLHRKGYRRLILQVGRGNFPSKLLESASSQVELLGNKPGTSLLPCNLEDFVRGEEKEVSLTWKVGDTQLQLLVFRYRGSIEQELRRADLVISHAGAGTSLEALALGRRLVVVVNDALMDQHQAELAERLSEMRCSVACRPHQLRDLLVAGDEEHLQPYVPGDPTQFCSYLDSVFVRR